MALALMLEDNAKASATGDDDPMGKLYLILNTFDIPKNQFYEVEKEIGDIK
jgi:hypothetical protein